MYLRPNYLIVSKFVDKKKKKKKKGGLILFSTNALIYVDQSSTNYGVAVNTYAEIETNYPLRIFFFFFD